MDGTGYPRGLRGTQIHLGGRILAGCADFDTLRAVGGNGAGTAVALRELARGAGTKYDAEVVRALADVVRHDVLAGVAIVPEADADLENARASA
jgi:HD-GYP domain-containing protein (c-di-GMP phosphodiesterase class II)